MMEPNQYDDPVKSPIVQEIILSNRIGAISLELSKRLDIDPVKALELFYESQTCADLHDKSRSSTCIVTSTLPTNLSKKNRIDKRKIHRVILFYIWHYSAATNLLKTYLVLTDLVADGNIVYFCG